MHFRWEFDPEDIARVKAFVAEWTDDAFVRDRMAVNLAERKPKVTREKFWKLLVACLLTTQQKSGPASSVMRFIRLNPFPLGLSVCEDCSCVATLAKSEIERF